MANRFHPPRLPPFERPLLVAALFCGVLMPFLAFGRVAEKVWRHGGFKHDAPILRALHAALPRMDGPMIWVSRLGDPRLLLVISAIVTLVLWLGRMRREAVFVTLSVGGAAFFNALAKALFQRPRPALWRSPSPEADYGFPSGHAMLSLALAVALALLFWKRPRHWPALVVGAAWVLLIGMSRLYLGVHFPSDVLAGWCASLAWVAGLFLALRRA
jgi:undecaprenyl-diphosphatase